MSNYKIIINQEALKSFIDWLPVLNPDEKYYLCLFARNKYCKQLTHIKSDKAQLKRFISDKERMYNKIEQLEVKLGAYKQKHLDVPQEALALYITMNPRNMYKASINTMVKLANSIRDQNINMNPHQEALSEIQRTKSRTYYVDFDIDFDDKIKNEDELFELIKDKINFNACTFLRSRGGVHILVKPDLVELKYKNNFYQNLSSLSDQQGDLMIPVVGCTQGVFVPHFIKMIN